MLLNFDPDFACYRETNDRDFDLLDTTSTQTIIAHITVALTHCKDRVDLMFYGSHERQYRVKRSISELCIEAQECMGDLFGKSQDADLQDVNEECTSNLEFPTDIAEKVPSDVHTTLQRLARLVERGFASLKFGIFDMPKTDITKLRSIGSLGHSQMTVEVS